MTPPNAGAPITEFDEEFEGTGVVRLLNLMLRHRRTIAILALLTFALVVTFTVLQRRTYTSTASFSPEGYDADQSGMSGLAAQFGIPVGGGQSESPDFYANLLNSREILQRLAETEFTVLTDSGQVIGTVAEIYGIDKGSEQSTLAYAVKELRGQLDVSTQPRINIVRFSVTTPWPQLSRDAAARLIELVNEFNLQTRQSQATAERRFVEARLQEKQEELRAAEDRVQRFLETSRQVQNSPELSFEYDRLQRRVLTLQQVVTSLTTAFEQTRLDEIRNTPVLTVLEAPDFPVEPNARGTIQKGILALAGGALLGVLLAFFSELMRRARERNPETFEEFRALRRQAIPSVPFRRRGGKTVKG